MMDYPSNLDVRPLTTWPGELRRPHQRIRAPFTAPLQSTVRQLDVEMRALAARHPVLEVALPAGGENWRMDGAPRANARPEHPGVVLSLPVTKYGPLRYATDVFSTWQDNLRAIVLGLDALRRVDRYGITKRGEQYAGWAALPPGTSNGPMTKDDALRVLDQYGGPKSAIKATHPDTGGSPEDWARVEEALRVARSS